MRSPNYTNLIGYCGKVIFNHFDCNWYQPAGQSYYGLAHWRQIHAEIICKNVTITTA